MKISRFVIVVCISFLFMSGNLVGGEMVYKPINPSFGGNSFNGSWLLSSAQAQNNITEKITDSRLERNELDDFKENLNRQILSRLSRELIANIFGEDSFAEEGRFELGDFIIDVLPGTDGLNINIIDVANAGETNIVIPYY
ncbi:MAG: curli production assembly/transport component CsgF [Calditrichaeota bacterium]|nr:MAG: curli production assembly/transport component CsgF [Calditrichota bacterium]